MTITGYRVAINIRDTGRAMVPSLLGDPPPLPPGLQISATPGHTAGHISVFDPSTGVLVAGDALRHNAGLNGSDPRYTVLFRCPQRIWIVVGGTEPCCIPPGPST